MLAAATRSEHAVRGIGERVWRGHGGGDEWREASGGVFPLHVAARRLSEQHPRVPCRSSDKTRSDASLSHPSASKRGRVAKEQVAKEEQRMNKEAVAKEVALARGTRKRRWPSNEQRMRWPGRRACMSA